MPYPTWSLQQPHGPIVKPFVTISTARAKVLRNDGLPVPQGVTLPALIDTGATSTVIDEASVRASGLVAKDVAHMHTTSTGDTAIECYQYDAYLAIADVQTFNIGDSPILSANFSEHGIKALIGRDVLSRCLLIYDGSNKSFTLAY